MITQSSNFFSIPLTRTLMACTIAAIATSIAILQGYSYIIPAAYAVIAMLLIYLKRSPYVIPFIACLLFSLQIILKIHSINSTHNADQEFLNDPVVIQGTIIQKQHSHLARDQTTVTMQTDHIYHSKHGTLKTPKKIIVTMTTKRAAWLQENQSIMIYKIILQQPKNETPYSTYSIKEGIWATAFLTSQTVRNAKHSQGSLYSKCFKLFSSQLNTKILDLFNPLFLGKREKTSSTLSIQHQSLYWGIAHHMARSGIHLVTLFSLFLALFHYIRIKHFYRYFICGALAIGYLEISIPSVSFLRALCMILFQIICKINKFQYSSVHALTLTTLLMVLHNPWYVLFLDFQLSFGITAVIIWLFQAKWSKTIAFPLKNIVPS